MKSFPPPFTAQPARAAQAAGGAGDILSPESPHMLRRLSYLLPYLARHRGKLILGHLAILASVVMGLMSPLLIGRAIDSMRADVAPGTLMRYALLLVGISLVGGAFGFIQRTLLVGMSRDIEFDLRNDYFRTLETQPPSFFYDHPTGDLMARATNDLQAVRMLCGPAIMYSANTLFAGVGVLFFMSRIDARLTLLSLVTLPLVAVATKVFGARIHSLFESVQGKFSDLSSRVQENLAGVRVVRAYAREEQEKEDFRRINQLYVEGNRKLISWSVAFHPLLQGLVGLGFAAVLWFGGRLVMEGGITLGEFVTFHFFLGRLTWPMIAIGWVINQAQRGSASLGRIRQILDVVPEIRDSENAVPGQAIRGAVSARGLTFSYRTSAEPVLAGIDLEVAAGETVAIVGRTGSGKSTLLALLPRLFDPPPGELAVDGTDVREIPLAELRGAIGMVPQETFLFSATLSENIALGRPEASPAEVLEAARLAGLAVDLESFPRGLATVVGERGITLSGGQKQRVALARALLRQPRILLLDDCLSAVDTHTEEEILRNLRQVFAGRTVFLVSHRVSTVQGADQILVLEGGRMVERGNHDQLLARGGLYADLHRRQRLEEELAAV
jgi:ATP-binding cassette, subfamily B, multidrug efflux pump